MSKRKLLAEILPIVGSNRACQRLVAQYREYLQKIHQQENAMETGGEEEDNVESFQVD